MLPQSPLHHQEDNNAAMITSISDTLSVMMRQECTTYLCRDYLNDDDSNNNGHHNNHHSSPPSCIRDYEDCSTIDSTRTVPTIITPDDRMKIVDWCYGIVDECKFDRETVAVAMNIVDRFMSSSAAAAAGTLSSSSNAAAAASPSSPIATRSHTPRPSPNSSQDFPQDFPQDSNNNNNNCYSLPQKRQRQPKPTNPTTTTNSSSSSNNNNNILHNRGQYQLLSLTALYISIKIKERTIFSSRDFSSASRGTYSTSDIESMERTILEGLGWRLCVPTPCQIGNMILELMERKCLAAVVVQDHHHRHRHYQGRRQPWHHDHQERGAGGNNSGGVMINLNFLRDELAFQTENAVREYYFTTHRSSTIAVISILNAMEDQHRHRHANSGGGRSVDTILMRTLICILKEFDFEEASVLLEARHRLRVFMEENEEEDLSVDVVNVDGGAGDDCISEDVTMAVTTSSSSSSSTVDDDVDLEHFPPSARQCCSIPR
ncbi:hypothetical protein ACHAXR_005435 [Thalassiosira sp. AJA248-18]